MYTSHFGLSETPFSISPDPRFLYMSHPHKEAMAHLIYGIEKGGGFVVLTGEIGTGKTTLCRCLVQQLPDQVDVALILNPQINHIELLATLCDELKIEWSHDATVKVLLDLLNEYLLKTYAEGRRAVLIIDEAQLLTRAVLEQVRILTNLETTKHKLLQIILVGQPELSATLNRKDLRQLAQRVTARYHLKPLNLEDTRVYVNYRLAVVGCRRRIFNNRALRHVYKHSTGVPRLINIICDRALLGAYTRNTQEVSTAILRKAAQEVLGDSVQRKSRWWRAPVVTLIFLTLVLGIFQAREGTVDVNKRIALFYQKSLDAVRDYLSVPIEVARPKAQPKVTFKAQNVPKKGRGLASQGNAGMQTQPMKTDFSTVLESSTIDYQHAFEDLVTQWVPVSLAATVSLDCLEIEYLGLKCLSQRGTWNNLRNYNRAAVLVLRHKGEEIPVLLKRVDAESVTVQIAREEHTYPTSEIGRYWYGKYVLLWRPPPLEYEQISTISKGPDVLWLRQALNRVAQVDGFDFIDVFNPDYDEALKQRVISFQKKHDISADGIVGVDTLIQLNTLLNEPGIPFLDGAPTG